MRAQIRGALGSDDAVLASSILVQHYEKPLRRLLVRLLKSPGAAEALAGAVLAACKRHVQDGGRASHPLLGGASGTAASSARAPSDPGTPHTSSGLVEQLIRHGAVALFGTRAVFPIVKEVLVSLGTTALGPRVRTPLEKACLRWALNRGDPETAALALAYLEADIRRWARAILRAKQDIDDVVATIKYRILHRVTESTRKPLNEPRGFVKRMTLNACIDLCNQEKKARQAASDLRDVASGAGQEAAQQLAHVMALEVHSVLRDTDFETLTRVIDLRSAGKKIPARLASKMQEICDRLGDLSLERVQGRFEQPGAPSRQERAACKAEAERLEKAGLARKEIAFQLGLALSTVHRWLAEKNKKKKKKKK